MRVLGIEPRNPTWKEGSLPLAYTRLFRLPKKSSVTSRGRVSDSNQRPAVYAWSHYEDLRPTLRFTKAVHRYLCFSGILLLIYRKFSFIMVINMSKQKTLNSHRKRELKNQLAKRYGHSCKICNNRYPLKSLTLDHIIPLKHGGSWNIRNLQLACYPCNQEKSDSYIDFWDTF